MNCLKCGQELKEGQVFCDDCLAGMEQEPVKINTPVKIPTQPVNKSTSYRRPMINPEEEVKRLRKVNQNLILALLLMTVAALLFGFFAYEQQFWETVDELGRNYSVVEMATGG